MPPTAPLRRSQRLWRIVVPLAVVAATTTGCFGGGASGGADAQYLLQRVNEVRVAAGLPALAWCGTLANAANKHTQDMAAHNFMGHIGTDGSDFIARANQHGYIRWTRISENVAAGPGSVEEVLAHWLGSSAHAANILNPGVNHAGFAQVGNHWTQMFGSNGAC